MFNEQKAMELLSFARHGLLNDLQLIKGYLFLKQPEKAEEIVERVTEKLHNQTGLTRLQIPQCAVFLMHYSWTAQDFHVTFHIDGKQKNLSAYDHSLALLFKELFSIIEQHASPLSENKVEIIFDTTEPETRISVYFIGILTDPHAAEQQVNNQIVYQSFQWVEHYIINDGSNENEVRWTMCLSIK
ncbi:Spo0B C-terminal domain-containing protein [Sporolactobacillus terrae]|uniref:Stage 0 sporulation initiation phosphotransferase B n=1 Tax=Sporolactobacillus terrae TaxID=269673 RepID=A0A410D9Y2_9BACL|nr:Spo0B C-terminal domain-containing protein [Sporolactobacillus terrae]QAA22917.1 stage 0 sporulation initiation phosphotransferase B [Sporolactobacillus terrae]QAA25890.1 stage 0 sporulation initiation phosphotransferase B [Sporolactobacillus terrae]UAK17765.1 sporulation initiation phosphotransferase B [Sporolactobacillus terrae]BBN99314.1 hypothetical protein St703_20190 [Sporolactobacillus terrae]